MSDPEPVEPAGGGPRGAMLAIPIATGFMVLIGTYLAGCGVPWGHVILAVATLVMGLLARAWLEPGKGAVVAFTLAVLLPLLVLSAFEPANVPLFKPFEPSSPYQLLSKVYASGRLAIVTGAATCALLMTVLFLKRRARTVGRAMPIALWGATVLLAGMAVLGAARLTERPSPRDFRATLRLVEVVRPPPVGEACLFGQCREILFEDRDALLFRQCRNVRDCCLWLDLRDDIGPRDIAGLRSDEPIILSANRERGVWALLVPSRYEPSGYRVEHAVGVRPRSSFVRAANLRGAIAPEPTSVAFTCAAAVLAAAGCAWLLFGRRRRGLLDAAREAEMDEDGFIHLGGNEPDLRRAEDGPGLAGPVLVAADNAPETYREAAAPPVRVLARGTKAQVLRRFAADARDVGAVVLASAAHLAVPLVADALAGRLL